MFSCNIPIKIKIILLQLLHYYTMNTECPFIFHNSENFRLLKRVALCSVCMPSWSSFQSQIPAKLAYIYIYIYIILYLNIYFLFIYYWNYIPTLCANTSEWSAGSQVWYLGPFAGFELRLRSSVCYRTPSLQHKYQTTGVNYTALCGHSLCATVQCIANTACLPV